MDIVDAEVPFGGKENEEEQTDKVLVPDVEEGTDISEQGHVVDEDEVDMPIETKEEDTGPILRSGTRYGLRRLTKPVNSHRNRFGYEFSGANVGIRSQTIRADVKPRIVHKTR